jgi:hypothetical protein
MVYRVHPASFTTGTVFFSTWVKGPRFEADHWPPCSVKAWTSTSPHVLMMFCLIKLYNFLVYLRYAYMSVAKTVQRRRIRCLMNTDLGRMWKETVVKWFEEVSGFLKVTEEDHKKSQSVLPVFRNTFEPTISRIPGWHATDLIEKVVWISEGLEF